MKQKLATILIALSLFSLPVFTQARGLVPCGGYDPALPGGREKPCNVEDIFVLIARVTNFLIAMAGVFAVFEIVGGGFWLVLSAGNEEAITKRKGQITSAVIGLIMVLMAFMFINTVVNFMVTRGSVNDPDSPSYNPKCRFDLTSPLTYLTIDSSCSNVAESSLHKQ